MQTWLMIVFLTAASQHGSDPRYPPPAFSEIAATGQTIARVYPSYEACWHDIPRVARADAGVMEAIAFCQPAYRVRAGS